MKFLISNDDIHDVEMKIRSFKNTLYYGPTFIITITILLLYRISLENASTSSLFGLGFVFLLPPLIFVVYAPMRAIRRYHKIIKEVQILEEEILIIHIDNTFSFVKDCKLTLTKFNYGSKSYEATLIDSIINIQSSVLIHKFFNEYDQIVKCFKTKMHSA